MVKCNLFGRYGNQLFQVSATIAYALKHKMKYAIPSHGLNFGKKTDYKFPNQRDIQINNTYTQPTHGYKEIPYFENVKLNGHFQSEKYFEDYRNEVRMELGFPKSRLDKCAIHVRRGDYLHSNGRFPVLPIEYYKNAILEMLKREVTEFVIFSDDIEWCKDNFIGYGYQFYKTENECEDLKHMAEYKYMIIANSSYSLFASLINDKECVIAPSNERWFGNGVNLDTSDLMPERFIKI